MFLVPKEKMERAIPESIQLAVSFALTDPAGAAALAEWWAESVPADIKDLLLPGRKK